MVEEITPEQAEKMARTAEENYKLLSSLEMYEALLEYNPYLYFELAHTRPTGWMCWVIDQQNSGRVVHAEGQGTRAEAIAIAHDALKKLFDELERQKK